MIIFPQNSKFEGIIGVCGASQIDKKIYRLVEELGRTIATEKFILATGGLGGTMEAASKGAKQAEGFTIGIIPSLDKKSANPYIDIVIPTGMGEARNNILIATADAIITVAGDSGTLSEIALAWKMNKPIVSLRTTGGWSTQLADKKIDNKREDKILSADSPKEAVKMIIQKLNFQKLK